MKAPVITLITDFGLSDEYVGVMKGVIASINPQATVIDITHHISPQNIIQAAFILWCSYQYFPKNTIHVVVVDPGVGSHRKIVAIKTNTYFFLSPDNGVLSFIIKKHDCSCVHVDRSEFFLSNISHTFHGRDIFSPVAAHLSNSMDIYNFGQSVLPEQLITIPQITPSFENNVITGMVIMNDRFGNIISNISLNHLNQTGIKPENASIHIGNHHISGIVSHYEQVRKGDLLAILGSKGFLEISINCGNACEALSVQSGCKIFVLKS